MQKLSEVNLIQDDEIRSEVKQAILKFPDYFWETSATSSPTYHNPLCREKYGLWIHTKMVCCNYLRKVPSKVYRDILTEYEADCGLAACILHDSFKGGLNGTSDGSATQDHSLVAARFVRNETDLPETVVGAVAAHMGDWYEGPAPRNELEELVHMADMDGSARNGTWRLYKPHRILTEEYPQIEEAKINENGLYK